MFKFVSNSHIALNVVLANGASVHVVFVEHTGKGSVFYTADEQLAAGLRSHVRFGKLFKEEAMPEPKPVAATTKKVKAEAAAEEGEAVENKKTFSNNEDAKDFLAERYGISRSKLRTRAAIETAAKSVGITIEWTE